MSTDGMSAADPLSEDEYSALKQLSKSFSRGTIAEHISQRLIKMGYAKEFMSNLIITDRGFERLAIGRNAGETSNDR